VGYWPPVNSMTPSAEFPEHKEALRTLHRSVEIWLGLRERAPFDF
jgi:hypothetical protein